MTVGTTPRGEDDAVSTEPEDGTTAQDSSQEPAGVMGLLAEGIPLALLADLANPKGPSSPAILEDEGLPDVEWWGGSDESGDDRGSEPDDEDSAAG